MVTLYHWDLPQALEDDGGWLNRDTVDRFAEYAAIVGERFADRVEHWIPVNEPNVVTMLGYAHRHARPGPDADLRRAAGRPPPAAGHGRAAIALRAAGATSVGCANNHAPIWPASDDDADVGRRPSCSTRSGTACSSSRCCSAATPPTSQPLLDDVVQPGDMATIRQPLDFYGVNYYNPMKIARRPRGRGDAVRDPRAARLPDDRLRLADRARRAARVADHASAPATAPRCRRSMITESGCSYGDGPGRARRRRRPARGSTTSTPTCARSPPRSSAASTSAATTRGR